jgi:CO/xanthine dehydrogenase Mo-binding subunit
MKVSPTVAIPPTVSAPKIKIAAKKQLTAKSALSAQSLRYLAKVKAKPGDKIIISLQSGKKKNVDLKKSYIYFKKPGTYVVKVKVDRKTGPTVTRYIRVTVKK